MNKAHLQLAEEKAKSCLSMNASCYTGPEFFFHSCKERQCAVRSVPADELVGGPEYLDIKPSQTICSEIQGKNLTLQLRVRNGLETTIEQLNAVIIGDGAALFSFGPVGMFTTRKLLSAPLLPNETRELTMSFLNDSIGRPMNVTIAPVQRIVVEGLDAGFVQSVKKVKIFKDIAPCAQSR